ncbi:glutamate synthase subunit beta [Clostridium gasigenes]|uniref:glutamate synthase subunit beta n=1 Tax=Clostridium gasigenes TaxID=94869 RepID=UPI001C0DE26E|nr:glutamate synthase subunit beta [Clostridium gasigenes]MBU3106317.1 glutamate synthase subunit beta [Clostridium gasigenes]
MGKTTGFLEFERREGESEKPLDRLKHWNEFNGLLSKGEQENQGARCMDCGVPFCQSGIMINGMASGCPINNLIPEWNDLIYRGKWKLALSRLLKTNNFPEFTGRVCPAPCESACTVGINAPSVTIKENEKSIIDRGFEEGLIKANPPTNRTGKKVAVIGSGPSGLAAADSLNKNGHLVTVFERDDRIGGLLMYGIPNMKLDKKVIDRRVNLLKEEGIEFAINTNVGKNYPVRKVLTDYDAVVLATGSSKPRDLKEEGREIKGIYYAVDFLKANTKSLLDSNFQDKKYIDVKDKKVIIIGGGDTGTDCVATSLRHGATSIMQLEIMDEMPNERALNNPWPQWARISKTDYGQKEFIELNGEDPRKYCKSVKKFIGDSEGNLKAVVTVNMEWRSDDAGRFTCTEVEGSEKIVEADVVLLAMGFIGTEDYIKDAFEVHLDNRGNIIGEYGDFRTNREKIFTAGDARRGQSLVVWAINEGRAVADVVNNYLEENKEVPNK